MWYKTHMSKFVEYTNSMPYDRVVDRRTDGCESDRERQFNV